MRCSRLLCASRECESTLGLFIVCYLSMLAMTQAQYNTDDFAISRYAKGHTQFVVFFGAAFLPLVCFPVAVLFVAGRSSSFCFFCGRISTSSSRDKESRLRPACWADAMLKWCNGSRVITSVMRGCASSTTRHCAMMDCRADVHERKKLTSNMLSRLVYIRHQGIWRGGYGANVLKSYSG